MPHYEVLDQESPHRLTVAHAIEAFENVGFAANDTANIRVGGLRLPSGQVVGLISALFPSLVHGKIFVVSLATSNRFQARREGSSELAQFDIFELDEARFSKAGELVLANGAK